MTVLHLMAWICIVLIFLRALQNSFHLNKNLNLFRRARSEHANEISLQRHFYLIIPVLREQAVIGETLRYFSKLEGDMRHFSIIIATTRREVLDHQKNATRLEELAGDIVGGMQIEKIYDKYAGVFDRITLKKMHNLSGLKKKEALLKIQKAHEEYILTNELAKDIAAKINSETRHGFVKVIEYPNQTGVVAHQINYAVKSLNAIQSKDYIGIYNADSRPPLDTLIQAEHAIEGHHVPPVIQQSSLFMLNASNTTNKGYAWKANALHQTMWTLKHEVTMLRRQSKYALKSNLSTSRLGKFLYTRFTVCVCHGLFVNASYYKKMPLPEDAVIEDTSYGLLQSLNKTPVLPLYALENSESPTSLTSVIRQKRTWFRLVFDLWDLCKSAYDGSLETTATRAEVGAIALQILPTYVIWIFHTIVTTLPLIVAICTLRWWIFAGWFLAMIVYWLIPALAINSKLGVLVGQQPLSMGQVSGIFVFGMPGILSHSLGPWFSVYDGIRNKLGLQVEKKKTER